LAVDHSVSIHVGASQLIGHDTGRKLARVCKLGEKEQAISFAADHSPHVADPGELDRSSLTQWLDCLDWHETPYLPPCGVALHRGNAARSAGRGSPATGARKRARAFSGLRFIASSQT